MTAALSTPAGSRSPRITEPATMVTDYLLATVAAAGAVVLFARAAGSVAVAAWGVAFTVTALGSAAGGTVHGFTEFLGERRTQALWIGTLVCVAVASAAMVAAAGAAVLAHAGGERLGTTLANSPARGWPLWIGMTVVAAGFLKLALMLVLVSRRAEFRVVLFDHAASLLLVLAALGVAASQGGAPGLPWIAGGVSVTALGGFVQARGLAPHRHFNHNDLFHIIQVGALLLHLRGGLLLGG